MEVGEVGGIREEGWRMGGKEVRGGREWGGEG